MPTFNSRVYVEFSTKRQWGERLTPRNKVHLVCALQLLQGVAIPLLIPCDLGNPRALPLITLASICVGCSIQTCLSRVLMQT